MNLKGKAVLITGTKRVGQTVVKAVASRGAKVAVHYNRSAEAAETLVEAIRADGGERSGVPAMTVQADVSDAEEVRSMTAAVVEAFGSLDVLIAMASIYEKRAFEEVTEKDWDRNMAINLKGTFLCAQAAAKIMLEKGAGKIITIADWAAIRPYRDYLPYLVSKGGVVTLTKALAVELAPTIQVNCIAPGPVLLPEDFTEKEREAVIRATPLKRIGSPEDIAQTVLYFLEGSDFVTGAVIPVDGGRLLGR